MGKGAGCGSSKNVQDDHNPSRVTESGAQQPPIAQPVTTSLPAAETKTPATMSATGTKKIYVIFYTTYGHIYKMVEEVVKGINSVPGTEAVLLQVCMTSRASAGVGCCAQASQALRDLLVANAFCLHASLSATSAVYRVRICRLVTACIGLEQHLRFACRSQRLCLRVFWRKCMRLPNPMFPSSTFMTFLKLMALFLPSQPGAKPLPLLGTARISLARYQKSEHLCTCRYGIAPAQFKAFMDATGQLWQNGALVGKPITFLTSTASLGGGQEVTILSSKF